MRIEPQDQVANWVKCFDYDAVTGMISWKRRPLEFFKSAVAMKRINGRDTGKTIKCLNESGYVVARVNDRLYRAHRIIWEMHNGPIPEGYEIDHINGIRTDNRVENLRLATRSQNNFNSKLRRDNTSGFKGVSWSKEMNKWEAYIKTYTGKVGLGYYDEPEEAHRVRLKAAIEQQGEFARTS